jgi:putative oxidoreductase
MEGEKLCTVSKVEEYTLRFFDYVGDIMLFLTRVFWGYQFYQTGHGKLEHLDRTTQFFANLGIPAPALNAKIAGSVECYGGLLLLFGFLSRPAALFLSGTMLTAYATAHRDTLVKLFARPGSLDALLNQPEAFTKAEPFLFLLVSVMVLSFGPGLFSADAALGRLIRGWLARHPRVAALWLGRTTAARVAPPAGLLDGCQKP